MPLLVFTDLDGTLLSHDGYDWQAARPALARLRRIGAGVVMASSKTAPEIDALRRDIGLQDWPAIVENGAGLLAAGGEATIEAADYVKLRGVLSGLPAPLRTLFRGFGDMDAAEISDVTGLSPTDAARAATRAFSEPGIWSGTRSEQTTFLIALAQKGVSAREGGRFLTLSFGATKADRMAQIIAELKPAHTAALGDAPNDIEMLQAADFGIIIANPHRAPLPLLAGEETGRIIRTREAGPAGWNTAMMDLMTRLNL